MAHGPTARLASPTLHPPLDAGVAGALEPSDAGPAMQSVQA
jgi:hypothetical protein